MSDFMYVKDRPKEDGVYLYLPTRQSTGIPVRVITHPRTGQRMVRHGMESTNVLHFTGWWAGPYPEPPIPPEETT